MTRTDAREMLMQMLFQMEVQKDYSEEAKEAFLAERSPLKSQKSYFDAAFEAITQNLETIKDTFGKYSNNWEYARLPNVDKVIITIAIAEIMYMEDISDAIAINEAVDMAKKFGTEKSPKFINGVLGQIQRGEAH